MVEPGGTGPCASVTEISTFTDGLQQNDDGLVEIYFGPEAPEDNASNWIKTNRGEYWFHIPSAPRTDRGVLRRSWPMFDVERVE